MNANLKYIYSISESLPVSNSLESYGRSGIATQLLSGTRESYLTLLPHSFLFKLLKHEVNWNFWDRQDHRMDFEFRG